jgi:hypothetical protein
VFRVCRSIPITKAGWYILQHVFLPKDCPSGINYPAGAKCVFAQMNVFRATAGGSCGSIVTTPSNVTASWEVGPRARTDFGVISDQVDETGGAR